MNKNIGVLYVALGYEYLIMALTSARSLKKYNNDLPVTIVTNVFTKSPNLEFLNKNQDEWIFVNEKKFSNRNIKIGMYDLSPYDYTLYLDCDTLILNDLSNIFSMLEYFDIGAYLYPQGISGRQSAISDIGLEHPLNYTNISNWNTGVICFKKNKKCESFFENWKMLFNNLGYKFDQPSFSATLFKSDICLLSLDQFWNKRVDRWCVKENDMNRLYVLHYMFAMDRNICEEISRTNLLIEKKSRKDMSKFLIQKRKSRYINFKEYKVNKNIYYLLDHFNRPSEILLHIKIELKNLLNIFRR